MTGTILGDMIGSPYEFRTIKTTEFPLFSEKSRYTDDTVMTLAVADAFMAAPEETDDRLRQVLTEKLRYWGRKYFRAGYGKKFFVWLLAKEPKPYNSYGNGSAMRVSSAAWLFDSVQEVRRAARLSAEITHNHPEGIRGAEAVASAVFLARTGSGKAEIRAFIEKEFGYALNRTCDEIRPGYTHIETCMESVPEAITAFLEGGSFEEAVRLAVSLGGDADTLAAITGSIAEAFFGIPEALRKEARARLPEDLLEILDRFESTITIKNPYAIKYSDF